MRSATHACTQTVELEGFATRYVGQALGGGDHWRGKLSAETDSRGQKVYRATRKVVVPPGLAFYSVYRSTTSLPSHTRCVARRRIRAERSNTAWSASCRACHILASDHAAASALNTVNAPWPAASIFELACMVHDGAVPTAHLMLLR